MENERALDGLIERELSENGYYASNTLGRSMQPLFKTHRDMVIIERVQGELKKYDVALYKDSHSRYVLHRVIAVRDGYYVMRGDNNFFRETVKKDAVIGVLVAYRNKNRRHSVNELHYKIYSRFWHYIYPFRAFFRKTRMALSRVKAKMKK